jgi:NAD(P)-dependent dehydrogenase (short-subunit alcohol dehydrogenase family)
MHSRRFHRARQVLKTTLLVGGAVTGVAVGLGARAIARRLQSRFDFSGKVVVITGGSRGLGFALASEFARLGAVVAICARDERELARSKEEIRRKYGTEVYEQVCDVTRSDDVAAFVSAVLARFGGIDVLVNNAGVMSVGPHNTQTLNDYQEAMDVMYWGVVHPTLAVLPHMRSRGEGRIANITSIGGRVSVPHLVPYCSAKFAAVGFSEGMRAELAREGIKVTTVCPGLMRTGSHLNAHFKGDHRREFLWFSIAASLPLVSIHARRAARKIIGAIQRGDAELTITPQARLATLAHGAFPGATSDVLGIVNRLLPMAMDNEQKRRPGWESETRVTRSFVTRAGRRAAEEFHQLDERAFA